LLARIATRLAVSLEYMASTGAKLLGERWGIDMTDRLWRDHLANFNDGDVRLFDEAFLRRWGDRVWMPGADDKTAAALLHVELASRIATQKLGYTQGVETAALTSVYLLFEQTRKICEAWPGARHLCDVAWDVLNRHVRPFTAKWHDKSEAGLLRSLDATDDFRAELAALQPVLRRFDLLLLEIRDGARPLPDDSQPKQVDIAAEMFAPSAWGIPGTDDATRSVNKHEADFIVARREHYDVDKTRPAVGLALSGGGIRSATFSLGVLAALARRNILCQVDYLSTVSGGGFVGAFLAAFLSSGSPPGSGNTGVGLRRDELPFRSEQRESAALGHIRQTSRYLATDSRWERWQVALAQLSGLLLNLLMLAALIAAFSLVEFLLHAVPFFEVPLDIALLAGGFAILSLLLVPLLIYVGLKPAIAEAIGSAVTAIAVALVVWIGLGALHDLYQARFERSPAELAWTLAVPLLLIAVGVIGERLLPRFKWVFGLLTRLAMPLFVFAFYLAFYFLFVRWPEWRTAVVAAVLLLVVYLLVFVDVNFTGLHRHYRRKLAGTFVIGPNGADAVASASGIKLSALADSHAAPYPIINAALNVPASRRPDMRGRLADFFSFTPHSCGSVVTGYLPTVDWEKANPELDLASAMAISGAAASPHMGLLTPTPFSFWLALLNVRLNYWIRKPTTSKWRVAGLVQLLSEMFGKIDERGAFLNLSDGGHIENLGAYELLRRRCRFVIVIDGEHDPKMTFNAITNLQRLAAIDLRARIDIDLDDLRLDPHGLSASHFRFCRIHYATGEKGYLLYLKLSLTGNEGEFLRRYKLDEPDFPHHSTANQFFTETQFEAYRSLGEHIGDKLFLKAVLGDLADQTEVEVGAWFKAIAESFLDPS
jgi:hypothetical protein